MRYAVTAQTERLLADLASLADAAEDRLSFASAAAQREWEAMRYRWPSEVDLRDGSIALSDHQLELMRSKVMRFVSILEAARRTLFLKATARTVEPRVCGQLRCEPAPSE